MDNDRRKLDYNGWLKKRAEKNVYIFKKYLPKQGGSPAFYSLPDARFIASCWIFFLLNLINSKGRDSFQNCYYEAETKRKKERTNVRAEMATVLRSCCSPLRQGRWKKLFTLRNIKYFFNILILLLFLEQSQLLRTISQHKISYPNIQHH